MEKQIIAICNDILFQNNDISCKLMEDWDEKEWEFAHTFTAQQGLLTILASQFQKIRVNSPDVKNVILSWFGEAETAKQLYYTRKGVMKELAEILQREGIDILFMKGATLAQLYPKQDWRMFSDIDYYLYGKSESGISILERYGVRTIEYEHHHTQASFKGVLIENHYDFFDCENHQCNHVLDTAMKELAETEGKSNRFLFDGSNIHNAYCMTPTMNAIFLMRHMSAHFVAETIPLRMLYDWSLFLKNYSISVNWDTVLSLYEKSGMLTFAELVQYIITEKMNIRIEGCPVNKNSHDIADEVWESLFLTPAINPYKKYSLRYNIYETKTFIKNRWKHKIVYPNESYLMLFLSYVWLRTKRKLGILSHGAHE